MFKTLGIFVARHPLAVMLFWFAAAVVARWTAPAWDSVTNDGDLAYLPDRMTTVRGERLLSQAFPENKAKSQLVLIAARKDGQLSPDDLLAVEKLGKAMVETADPPLPSVDLWTPSSEVIGKKLVSADRHAALAVVPLETEFMAVQNIQVLQAALKVLDNFRDRPDFPKGLELGISGSGAVGGDMLSSAEDSVRNTETITLLLVVGILFLVYRSPILVFIPVLTLGVSFVVACDLVASLTQLHNVSGFEWVDFKIFKTSKIFIITILFGSGTDFCLFLIARYREELGHGMSRPDALAAALGNVGSAITASAMTTMFGLGTMFFADFGKYRDSGPTIGLCLCVGLIACLTLAPALLRVLGRVVFWPMGIGHGGAPLKSPGPAGPGSNSAVHNHVHSGDTTFDDDEPLAPVITSRGKSWSNRFWHDMSGLVVRRPGLILTAAVLLMMPLAVVGWGTPVTYNLLAELDPSRPSVHGTELLTEHFKPGETGPVTILAYRPGAKFDSKEGDQDIARLTKILYDIPGVESVRSMAEPLGDTPGLANPFSPAGRLKMAAKRHRQTRATYLTQVPALGGDVTRLDALLDVDPFSPEAIEVLDRIDSRLAELSHDPNSPWHDVQFDFLGTTAATRDLMAVTQSDERLIQALVVITVLAILIVLLRQPLVCVYLIVSVLFSYLVTLGTTELVFQFWFETFHGLDWKVPLFLFVILVAVGEDYNIYLVTRVFEEQQRHGRLEGLRIAVERTGGIITSCGVIMAGTFVSMMAGNLRGMLELGFALTMGVMLDTIVVRPILVPAFMALMYRFEGQRRAIVLDEALPIAATPNSLAGASKLRQTTSSR